MRQFHSNEEQIINDHDVETERKTGGYIRRKAGRTAWSVGAADVSRILRSEWIKHHPTSASTTATQWVQIVAPKTKCISLSMDVVESW